MKKKLKYRILKCVAFLLLMCLFMETVLRFLVWLPDKRSDNFLSRAMHPDFNDENVAWKRRFLIRYAALKENALPISQGECMPHPTLGWVPRPSESFVNKRGQRYTTNSMGFRTQREYVPDPDRYTVIILGDSFTYGSEADDSEIWPTLLQQGDNRLQVLNLGVPGYGTDQMLLMLREHVERLQPDLVIAAFISDNLHRATLSFRSFQKPKFSIQERRLVLGNTPIPSLEEVIKRTQRELHIAPAFTEIRLMRLAGNIVTKLLGMQKQDYETERQELNVLIFEEMIRECEEHDADFMMVYLPMAGELCESSFRTYGEKFFEDFCGEHGVYSANPRPVFLRSEGPFSMGHYTGREAKIVAESVLRKIHALPSFRGKTTKEYLTSVESSNIITLDR